MDKRLHELQSYTMWYMNLKTERVVRKFIMIWHYKLLHVETTDETKNEIRLYGQMAHGR